MMQPDDSRARARAAATAERRGEMQNNGRRCASNAHSVERAVHASAHLDPDRSTRTSWVHREGGVRHVAAATFLTTRYLVRLSGNIDVVISISVFMITFPW